MPQANAVTLIRALGSTPSPRPSTTAADRAAHRSAVLCYQAHAELIHSLASIQPNRIVGLAADEIDIEVRREHLREALTAVAKYALTIIADTNTKVALGTVDEDWTSGLFDDLVSEIMGAFNDCARRTAENQESNGGSW